MRISYSAIETYKTCPQKYKFQEIDRIRGKKSKEAVFGTAVHSALEYMFSRDPLFPTIEEVLARFRATLLESAALTDEQKRLYEKRGEQMLVSFYKKNPPWNFTVLDLESRFEVALDDALKDKHHILVGKIDRIDKPDERTYEIIDYKTSSKLPSQDAVNANLQLSLYQLGLQKRWPHIDPADVKLSLYYLKAGEKLETVRTAEDLSRTERALIGNLRTIEEKTQQNDFPPTPGPLCNWCSFKPICPAWKHFYEKDAESASPEAEDIQTLVAEYAQLKKEISDREAELKKRATAIHAYLNASGLERLFGDSIIIARKLQERTNFDMDKLRSVLEPAGLWQDVLAPDPKRLKKILPTLPDELQEQVKDAIVLKRFFVLGISKLKPGDTPATDGDDVNASDH